MTDCWSYFRRTLCAQAGVELLASVQRREREPQWTPVERRAFLACCILRHWITAKEARRLGYGA